MNETQATVKLCRELEAIGCLTFAIVGSQMQETGLPDRYIAHAKWTGWVEFKSWKGTLSPKQKWIQRELQKRGVNYCLVKFSLDYSYIVLNNIATCPVNGRAFLETLCNGLC